jgi:hypothetical protein
MAAGYINLILNTKYILLSIFSYTIYSICIFTTLYYIYISNQAF